MQLFMVEWRREQRALGRKIAAHQGHAEGRAAFESLSAKQRECWDDTSEARKSLANLTQRSSSSSGLLEATPTAIEIRGADSDEYVPAGSASSELAPTNQGHYAVEDWLHGRSGGDRPIMEYTDFNRHGPLAVGPFADRLKAILEGMFAGGGKANTHLRRKGL